jgi:hypothetical protein
LRFEKLESGCIHCHTEWEAGEFDHAKTGLILDENHADWDCIDCHLEGRFDQPPSCSDCHEEEEEISFPAKLPGKRFKPGGNGS